MARVGPLRPRKKVANHNLDQRVPQCSFQLVVWNARGEPTVAIEMIVSLFGLAVEMQGLNKVPPSKSDLCTLHRVSLVIFVQNNAYFRAFPMF